MAGKPHETPFQFRPTHVLSGSWALSGAHQAPSSSTMALALGRAAKRLRLCGPLRAASLTQWARALHGTSEREAPPKPVELRKMKDSFLDGTSSTYLEELEERYRANPQSVDKSWASFFKSLGAPQPPPLAVAFPVLLLLMLTGWVLLTALARLTGALDGAGDLLCYGASTTSAGGVAAAAPAGWAATWPCGFDPPYPFPTGSATASPSATHPTPLQTWACPRNRWRRIAKPLRSALGADAPSPILSSLQTWACPRSRWRRPTTPLRRGRCPPPSPRRRSATRRSRRACGCCCWCGPTRWRATSPQT